LPFINLLSWLELVKKLGVFPIVKKFDIIFTKSVAKLIPFMLYFSVMLITFLTTNSIILKNEYRRE